MEYESDARARSMGCSPGQVIDSTEDADCTQYTRSNGSTFGLADVMTRDL
jgi:hypothetical protein